MSMYPTKPAHLEFHREIVEILTDGWRGFKACLTDYCADEFSSTLLGWGNEKSYLSLFSHGLNTEKRICFLEANFTRRANEKIGRKKALKEWKGKIDAFLVDRNNRGKTLTAIIEAKSVYNAILNPDSGVNSTVYAFKNSRDQLDTVDPEVICADEKFSSKWKNYRIALIFTVLAIRCADLEGYRSYSSIKKTAKEHFENIEKKLREDKTLKKNLLTLPYYHNKRQFDSIKDYYGDEMWDDKKQQNVPRPYTYTYYPFGVLLTVGLFR